MDSLSCLSDQLKFAMFVTGELLYSRLLTRVANFCFFAKVKHSHEN